MNCPQDGKFCPLPKSVHITEISNNEAATLDICAHCPLLSSLQSSQPPLNLPPLPSAILQILLHKKCMKCDTTLKEIIEKGRLGCPHCYTDFASNIKRVLMITQDGKVKHKGKVPKTQNKEKRISDIEAAMQLAIKNENYEEAASLRDQIKNLRK